MPDGEAWSATCWRDGSDWLVHVPALGASAHAALLAQVEDTARSLFRTHGHDPPAAVAVDLLLPPRLRALLQAAEQARAASDGVDVGEVRTRRRIARDLAEEGLPVPDIAVALGVSLGRAQVLAAPVLGPGTPGRGHAPTLPSATVPVQRPPTRSPGARPASTGRRTHSSGA